MVKYAEYFRQLLYTNTFPFPEKHKLSSTSVCQNIGLLGHSVGAGLESYVAAAAAKAGQPFKSVMYMAPQTQVCCWLWGTSHAAALISRSSCVALIVSHEMQAHSACTAWCRCLPFRTLCACRWSLCLYHSAWLNSTTQPSVICLHGQFKHSVLSLQGIMLSEQLTVSSLFSCFT